MIISSVVNQKRLFSFIQKSAFSIFNISGGLKQRDSTELSNFFGFRSIEKILD